MRRSFEDFQAEVFRRSAAFRQAQRVRRRYAAAGAGALLGCVVLTFGFTRINSKNDEWFTNDIAMLAGSSSAADCELSEEYAEMIGEDSFSGVGSDNGGSFADFADAVDESTQNAAGSFVQMTEDELYDHYGIAPLPQQLGDLRLVDFCTPMGIRYADADSAAVLDDTNTWLYQDGAQSAKLSIRCVQDDQEGFETVYTAGTSGVAYEYCAYASGCGLAVEIETNGMSFDAMKSLTEQIIAHIQIN